MPAEEQVSSSAARMPRPEHARALPRLDRVLLLAKLLALTALAWLYLVLMPMSQEDLGGFVGRLPAALPSHLVAIWLTFMMWAVMMVAMMLPSAAPMIMFYARIARGKGASRRRVWLFGLGYLVVWTLFSAGAAAAQAALQRLALLSNDLTTTPIAGGTILIAAGIYQLTPLKNACLGRCQSPMAFLVSNWREGAAGALRMGLEHGAFCVGCCWMLMALLFVAGVMNLAWVAAISIFVLIEKLVPYPRLVAYSAGGALIVFGLFLVGRG